MEGDFVLAAQDDFSKVERLSIWWREPKRINRALSGYVYEVKDLQKGEPVNHRGTRLKVSHDAFLDHEAILSQVLRLETGMSVHLLLNFVETADGNVPASFKRFLA